MYEYIEPFKNKDEANQPNTPKNPLPLGVGILILIIIGVFFWIKCDSSNGSSSDNSQESDIQVQAQIIAREEVKKQLNYPKTADFPFFGADVEKFGNNVYKVKGTVTAKNALGVEEEANYTVTLTFWGDDDHGNGDSRKRENWQVTGCMLSPTR